MAFCTLSLGSICNSAAKRKTTPFTVRFFCGGYHQCKIYAVEVYVMAQNLRRKNIQCCEADGAAEQWKGLRVFFAKQIGTLSVVVAYLHAERRVNRWLQRTPFSAFPLTTGASFFRGFFSGLSPLQSPRVFIANGMHLRTF